MENSSKTDREKVLCVCTPDAKAMRSFNLGCFLPIMLSGPLVMLLATFIKKGEDIGVLGGLLTLIGFPVGLIAIIHSWVVRKSFTLTVTTSRCSLVRGFLSKTTIEVPSKSIRSVQIERSVPDRILGTGTISITTTGDKPEIKIPQVARPDFVSECIKRTLP